MAVDNKNVIDVISTDFEGVVVLTISDHLQWDDENEHLLILQDKINVYLDVLQNGQIYESYPDSVGKAFRIQIALKYSPNKIGFDFLNQIQIVLRDNGYDFKYYNLQ